MLTVRTDGLEISESRTVGQPQDSHVVGHIKCTRAVEVRNTFGVVVIDDYDVVLDRDADETLQKPEQVARACERIALLHIHEIKEVRDMRLQNLEGVLNDLRIGAALGEDQESIGLVERSHDLLPLCPSAILDVGKLPGDG